MAIFDDFARGGYQVVQSDTINIAGEEPVVLHVSAASGAIKVLCDDGSDLTFQVPTAGWYVPVRVVRVYDTGTSVANADIVALKI